MIRFTVITLYPEAFPGTLGVSLAGRTLGTQWFLNVINLRNYGIGVHKQVDDEVYGGGSGMLIRADILGNALTDCLKNKENATILATSPRGFTYDQKIATNLSQASSEIIIICGRFEGMDYRIIEHFNILEVSIGNFVLFGGEVAAMCIMESIIRLQDGVCGNASSVEEESFAVGTDFENLMEYPQYTRPATWNGIEVPAVLRSGNHAEIKKWRLQQSKKLTEFYQHNQYKIHKKKF